MPLSLRPAIFGSALRTQILVLTALLSETYASQLARILKSSVRVVRLAVRRLERERLLATRRWGNERRITLDPSTAFNAELRALLLKLADAYPEYDAMIASLRTRPRRFGKRVEPIESDQSSRARALAEKRS